MTQANVVGGKCSVFYIPSDLLWVWEQSWCEIKLREKGGKVPDKEIHSA